MLLIYIFILVIGYEPTECALFFKIFEKMQAFRCNVLLRGSKLVHLDGKNWACLTWNLLYNLMNLVFFAKATGSGQKFAKFKVVRENANRCRSEAKG